MHWPILSYIVLQGPESRQEISSHMFGSCNSEYGLLQSAFFSLQQSIVNMSEQPDPGQHFIWGNSWDTAGSVVLSLQTVMVHLLLLVRLPVEPSLIGGPWSRQARQNLRLPELPYFLSSSMDQIYAEFQAIQSTL